MRQLITRAPIPSLPDHPEFPFMVTVTLDRFHCTLGEVREDYWLGRAWRALTGDPELQGRVARVGVGSVLITGPGHSAAARSSGEYDYWRSHVLERVMADTEHSTDQLGIAVYFAEQRIETAEACLQSLIAQTVMSDPRWADLDRYSEDLSPVPVPVALAAHTVVAA